MKRLSLYLFISLLISAIPCTTFAFTRDYYIADQSVIYQVHHTVMKWSTTDDYRFVKYFPKEGKPEYWIAIEIGDSAKSIFSDKSSIAIDGKVFYIQKNSEKNLKYFNAIERSYSIAFFDLSDEIVNTLQNCSSSVEIKYSLQTREKPIIWNLDQGKIKEFKDVINSERESIK